MIVNVTATESASSGNLGVYGEVVPAIYDTSNINFTTGETISNLALADAGDNGPTSTQNDISIHNDSGGTIELIVDCLGYFSPG